MDPNVFETANAGFAQALYEEYLRDPTAVSPEWRRLFESGRVGEQPPAGGNGAGQTGDGRTDGQSDGRAASQADGTTALAQAAPASPPVRPASGRSAVPLRGPGARLVANMNESLTVPTATTFRELPVRVLESRRAELNAGLQAARRTEKLSFTHLIGYALVQAVRQHAVMGHSLAVIDGAPHRVVPDGIHLGLAVDVTRKDGSRGLVVPVLRHAERMGFAEFHASYESLVERARTNKLLPDDFQGASLTLTNPGGLGTVASVPRLMTGQGSIIAVGAIGYPPEYATVPPQRRAELGVSKVMMITSTYDHRVIQGAESGEFLRTLDGLLQGQDRFYEGVSEHLGITLEADGRTGGRADGASATTAPPAAIPPVHPSTESDLLHVAAAMALVKAYRTHGHLAARLDPLGSEPLGDPALDPEPLGLTPEVMARIPASVLRIAVPGQTLAEALPNLQATYCGTIAYEVEHLSSHQQRVWLREQIESGAHRQPVDREARMALLDRLISVEAFERFLHTAYLGHKRFSIEGVDLLVPMLDRLLALAAERGARQVVLGMAHRGRLNVLTHVVGRPYVTIFAEFEGTKARRTHEIREGEDEETGDVKYHHGAEGAYRTRAGKVISVSLAHNPSHLEYVCPVVEGRARAQQTSRRGRELHHDPTDVLPVLIHGDAAFAGLGVVQETLNLGALRGYDTGGTVHLIVNNQVGFTTDMEDARSTRYASDLAKGFDIPIIHVNGDDPEACLAAVQLAMRYGARFQHDVLIDLVGYRRHGHNEADEPAYTQPLMYEAIKRHPTVREIYSQRLVAEGSLSEAEAEQRYQRAYQQLAEIQQGFKASLAHAPAEPAPARVVPGQEPETAVAAERLSALNQQLLTWPEGFTPHPKLARQLERRRAALDAASGAALGAEGGIDWGHAEALGFASLLVEGVAIRLTGQDTERGTFSHRHLVLHDVETGATCCPMQRLPGALASFEVHNSPLSELGTLGFEYGYSIAASDTLVLWEAQFGDFINGAQVVVDQFLAAGLSKWGVTSRLTLLLPHGYEGQGPEHSSARMERFLQLAAEQNLRLANCSTAAQYFHLLRRQARRNRQRPLVIFTPKSLLRLPRACSRLEDLTQGRFHPVLDDPATAGREERVQRLVLCSGKIYYDLQGEAERLGEARPALVRLEKLYSFPEVELRTVLGRYAGLREVVWAQEEPHNMGAWTYVEPRLGALLPDGVPLSYVGRPDRASPAEGSPAAHEVEQKRIVKEALGI